jgi:hypothetical protein
VVFNEFRGHFLTRLEVADIMGCSADDVSAHPDLLRVPGLYPGEELYPAPQFDHAGLPTPGLALLAVRLREELADREIASFCTHPIRTLGGRSPIEWLRQGGPVDLAAQAAIAA